jgi:hypothetical protein
MAIKDDLLLKRSCFSGLPVELTETASYVLDDVKIFSSTMETGRLESRVD